MLYRLRRLQSSLKDLFARIAGRAPSEDGPFSLNQVLRRELQELRPGLFDDFEATPFAAPKSTDAAWDANKQKRSENLRFLYTRIAKLGKGAAPGKGGSKPLAALCLSGGGIRSATFNLGILQALAKIGVLKEFDFLSSVSGGGYIAGWLKAWMSREGSDRVNQALGRSATHPTANPLEPEPKPIDNLREYSNYLTPAGSFSPDSWTAGAIFMSG